MISYENTDNKDNVIHSELTSQIIGCAHSVCHSLGRGFLEKVYENALVIELREAGLEVHQQYPFSGSYKDHKVGEYFADMLVNGTVIVELKSVPVLNNIHEVFHPKPLKTD